MNKNGIKRVTPSKELLKTGLFCYQNYEKKHEKSSFRIFEKKIEFSSKRAKISLLSQL